MASISTFSAAGLAPPTLPNRAHCRRLRRRPTSVAASTFPPSSSNSWWTPIFGWSPDPDYVDGEGEKKPPPAEARAKFAPGGFTEEKARQLRMSMMESETFHDAMYHSAIAARLASDLSARRGV